MHEKLSKSPIVYVLAQVRFSNIENIEYYIPQLQDKIRTTFPHYQKINIQAIQLREGQPPNSSTLTQWHFMDKEKYIGIILDGRSIAIHTSRYDQFTPLLKSFVTVLTQFNKILEISLCTRLGLRYINLIENGLSNINQGLQGFQLSGDDFSKNKFFSKMETTQLSNDGIIKVQALHFGEKQVIGETQNIFVPSDVSDSANMLSFKNHKEPDNNFLILDVDHFNEDQRDFNVLEISSGFTRLQEAVYQAFCQAAGNENLKNWA